MNCYIQITRRNGVSNRLETAPNGHPDHVYPSRGWATASASQWIDSFRNGVKTCNPVVKLEIIIDGTGEIYKTFKI